jgi:hypothetical protein
MSPMIKKMLIFLSAVVLLGLAAAYWPKAQPPEIYYFQIKDLHLRIPQKYAPWQYNDAKLIKQASKPPGLRLDSIYFMEQDDKTLERFIGTGTNHIWFKLIETGLLNGESSSEFPKSFPKSAWADSLRDSKNDLFSLKAFSTFNSRSDFLNYRYDFEDGQILYMSCTGFNFPRPICYVTTTWHGLRFEYMQSHINLSEWLSFYQQLTKHLNAFIYQPKI